MKKILVFFVIVVILGLSLAFWWALTPPTKTEGPSGYNTANSEIDNQPRENPYAMQDGTPTFTSGTLHGYQCVRCSDTGALDTKQVDKYPKVTRQCSSMASTSWNRAEDFVKTQNSGGMALGNWMGTESSTPKQNEDPFDFCKRNCNTINTHMSSVIGTCGAVTYDKVSDNCTYWFNCDTVKKVEPTFVDSVTTHIMDFDPSKQPDVIKQY